MKQKECSELVVGRLYYSDDETYPNDICRFELFDEDGNPHYSVVRGCEVYEKSPIYSDLIGFAKWNYPSIEYTGKL